MVLGGLLKDLIGKELLLVPNTPYHTPPRSLDLHAWF